MLTSDLDYDLPAELIARVPVEPRDGARLLVVDRATGRITHAAIRDLPELLGPRDRVVHTDPAFTCLGSSPVWDNECAGTSPYRRKIDWTIYGKAGVKGKIKEWGNQGSARVL